MHYMSKNNGPSDSNYALKVHECYRVGDAEGLEIMQKQTEKQRLQGKVSNVVAIVLLAGISVAFAYMWATALTSGLPASGMVPLALTASVGLGISLGLLAVVAESALNPKTEARGCLLRKVDDATRDIEQKRALELMDAAQWGSAEEA